MSINYRNIALMVRKKIIKTNKFQNSMLFPVQVLAITVIVEHKIYSGIPRWVAAGFITATLFQALENL